MQRCIIQQDQFPVKIRPSPLTVTNKHTCMYTILFSSEPILRRDRCNEISQITFSFISTLEFVQVIFFFLKGFTIIVPFGISSVETLDCFPWGTPAATQLHYPTYGACWVFQFFHNPLNYDMHYRIFKMHTDVCACDCIGGVRTPVRESALRVDSGRLGLKLCWNPLLQRE